MYIRSIGIAVLIFGTLFKVLHWPGANLMILTGGVVAALAAIAVLITKPGPKPASAVLRMVTGALLIAFLLFKLFHLPFADVWMLAAVVSTVGLLFVERAHPRTQHVLGLRFSALLLVALVLVVCGSIFKVMHWPGANIQLLLGMTGCAIWFLIPQPKTVGDYITQ
jgi:phosphatidylserine synthase